MKYVAPAQGAAAASAPAAPKASSLTGAPAAKLARRAAYAAISVGAFLLLIKAVAGILTGSVSLLGSFLDSLLDTAASVLNALALREASLPADREHRFGHGKAEPIAGLGQAALIAASAAFLLFESVQRLIHPEPLANGIIGIGVIVISMVFTVALVLYQRMVVRRTGSLAITADSLHYRSDLVLNTGVILGIMAGALFGLARVDAFIGVLVAVYIAHSAWSIVRLAYDQLMDREFDEADRDRIKTIIAHHPDVRAMHDLRTRRAGFDSFIQLHIELDPMLPLVRAHTIADRVEAEIKAAFPNAEVIIHEDPAGVEDLSDVLKS